jgi:hypothetical protein
VGANYKNEIEFSIFFCAFRFFKSQDDKKSFRFVTSFYLTKSHNSTRSSRIFDQLHSNILSFKMSGKLTVGSCIDEDGHIDVGNFLNTNKKVMLPMMKTKFKKSKEESTPREIMKDTILKLL